MDQTKDVLAMRKRVQPNQGTAHLQDLNYYTKHGSPDQAHQVAFKKAP